MGQVIGALLAVLLGMLAIPQLLTMSRTANLNMTASNVAEQAIQFNNAISSYAQTHATAIQGVAGATTPAVVTVDMLKSTNFLPSSFREETAYGGRFQAQILQPTPGNLQILAVTAGGEPLPDNRLVKISKLVGNQGGFVPLNDTGGYAADTAYGTGWGPMPITNYSVGHGELASLITLADGQLVDNRLYRNAIPGQPQLNTMNTPIIMAAIVTEDSACTTDGAIARNSNGVIVSCQLGIWKRQEGSFWRNPVATYSTLPPSDETGTVRMALDIGRAFMKTAGGSWQALAVDQNGNFTVPGKATINQLDGSLEVVSKGVEFAPCAPNNRIATEADGSLLSCQNGTWNRQKSRWAMEDGDLCPSKNAGGIQSGTMICTGSSPIWPQLPITNPNGLPPMLGPWTYYLCAGGQWLNMGSCAPSSEGTG